MPAASEPQRRFFGAVVAYKRGKLKDASPALKEASGSISEGDAIDFSKRVKKRRDLAKQMTSSMAKY